MYNYIHEQLTGSSEPAAYITEFQNVFLMELSNATHSPHPPEDVDVRSPVRTGQGTVHPRIKNGVYQGHLCRQRLEDFTMLLCGQFKCNT